MSDQEQHPAREMIGKMWDAQCDMFEAGDVATKDPTFVVPVRWEQVPENLKVRMAIAASPVIFQFNTLMNAISNLARAANN